MDYSFIKSNRFHALVAIAVFSMLGHYGVIEPALMMSIITVLLGHIGIRTVDRFSEEVGGKK